MRDQPDINIMSPEKSVANYFHKRGIRLHHYFNTVLNLLFCFKKDKDIPAHYQEHDYSEKYQVSFAFVSF